MTDVAAIRWVFLLQPLALGAWFPRIPQVQEAIGLSEGDLAFALIGMPIGLLSALFFGGKIAEALGTRGLLTVGLGSYVLLMPVPAFAASWWWLFLALMLAGIAMALAQLSLNLTAAEVESRSGRHIMNGCHGFWSVGVLIGAATGSVMAEFAVTPGASLIFVSGLCLLPLLMIARSITDYPLTSDAEPSVTRARPSRQLIMIAFFGFGVSTTEGAMADWLAVFMTNIFQTSPGVAGAGYVVFAFCLALGRFLGDALKAQIEVAVLARSLVGLAMLGLVVMLSSPFVWLSFVGVAMMGFGVSIGFPLAVSAVAGLKGRSTAANMALLTQITLCGFLIGPPVIGLIAEHSDMRFGLAGLFPALVLALAMTPALRPAGLGNPVKPA